MSCHDNTKDLAMPAEKDAELLAMFNASLHALREDMSEIKNTQKSMASAINKLAVIEERQTTTANALERAFGAIAKLEDRLREEFEKRDVREAAIKDRIDHLERNSVNHTRTSRLVDMTIVGAAVMLVQLVASKVGIG